MTALHLAVQIANADTVRLLLKAGANINGKIGRTPLYYAAEENRRNVADVLFAAGANPMLSSYSGCTPLLTATSRSHDDMVRLLEHYGTVETDSRTAGIRESEDIKLAL